MENNRKNEGYVVGNSALAADVSADGTLFGRITYNPPCFTPGGNSRCSVGSSQVTFACGGRRFADRELNWVVDEKLYPVYRAHTCIGTCEIRLVSFAPLSVRDVEKTFIPAIITRLEFVNGSDEACPVEVQADWQVQKAFGEADRAALRTVSRGSASFSGFHMLFTGSEGFDSADAWLGDGGVYTQRCAVSVGAKQTVGACVWFGVFDPENARARFAAKDAEALSFRIAENYPELHDELLDFISCIPDTGDGEIYRYTRWYAQAAVLLTKSTGKDKTITMGYNELNQRDSFWTSFLHLTLWPELEREIIRTSIGGMRADGKVPTCILPTIERERDVDINEYFCLRIARYFAFRHDVPFLRETFPYYKKAVDWLLTRDLDGDGIPEQAPPDDKMAFWADWKDVSYITGRKLAPHFALLWLAVLREGEKLATVTGDSETAAVYGRMYETAYRRINADTADGGLWNGRCYTELWYDGRQIDNVLIDQTVGILWGIVPPERVTRIYKTLTENENTYGIPETYPYRSLTEYPGANPPGLYHNGGIWPYLTFCDTLGRYRNGCGVDAERLIRKIGYYDLEKTGDHSPNEYLNGETGENEGMEVQGWSSALLGTILFGAFEPHYDGERFTLKLNFPRRDFVTRYPLPFSDSFITVSRRGGKLSCSDGSGRVTLVE